MLAGLLLNGSPMSTSAARRLSVLASVVATLFGCVAGAHETDADEVDVVADAGTDSEREAAIDSGALEDEPDGDEPDDGGPGRDEPDAGPVDVPDAPPADADDAGPATIPGPKLKLMTFNVRVGTAADGPNAWSLRKGLVFDVFKKEDADLVGLQEDLRFQLQEIADAVPGYGRIGVGARDGKAAGEHCAILYRKSTLALKESGAFWLSGKPEVPGSATWGNEHPRVVTWGRFAVKATGYELYLYNTHFDHQSQNAREKSAVLLMSRIRARSPKAPFAMMGDLNVQEDNVVTRFFKGKAQIDGNENPIPLFDTFRVLHPDDPDARTAHGFGGATRGQKIDYVYTQTKDVRGARIVHYNVDGRYPSDHYPVVATVKFPAVAE